MTSRSQNAQATRGPRAVMYARSSRLSSTHRERRILFRVGLRLRALSCLVPPHRYGEWAVRPSRQKPRSAPQVPAGRAAGLSSALHSGLCPTQRPVSVAGKMTPGSSKRTSPGLSHSNKDPVAGLTGGKTISPPPSFVRDRDIASPITKDRVTVYQHARLMCMWDNARGTGVAP